MWKLFFFQDHYYNYEMVNNFSQFLFQLEKERAENAAGEILLCNQALEAAVNHKSPLFIPLHKGNKAHIHSALNSLPGTHEELHVQYDTQFS